MFTLYIPMIITQNNKTLEKEINDKIAKVEKNTMVKLQYFWRAENNGRCKDRSDNKISKPQITIL